ncbi:MAG: hypothetical protein ACNS62_24675 [Candidatus Cyclobacteriaceae bacterium M3_2C_046]
MKKLAWSIFLVVFLAQTGFSETIYIIVGKNQSQLEHNAADILTSYLEKIYVEDDFLLVNEAPVQGHQLIFVGSKNGLERHPGLLTNQIPSEPEGYAVYTAQFNQQPSAVIAGYDEPGTLYGVFALLEKLGCGFYLSYETLPAQKQVFSMADWNLSDYPRYPVRMVFNWHNFLSGISTWNQNDWEKWIEQSAKMKYNTIVVHAYGNNPMLPLEFQGQQKEVGYLASTAKGQDWGTNHTNDVRRLIGAGSIFQDSIFAADAAKVPDHKRVEAAVRLTQDAFEQADRYGMKVAFAFDIATGSSVPKNIVNTLPYQARLTTRGTDYPHPEVKEGYDYFKAQVSQIMELYPQIDHFVPWVRYMWPDTTADWMRVEHFPKPWDQDYKNIISVKKMQDNSFNRSLYFIGKICKAYRKALDELGYDEVKLGVGTWNWHSFTSMDVFLPDHVEFFPLDWNMDFETEFAEKTLMAIDENRKIYPIVWAHHDDHRYIGKPYTPYKNFYDLLQQRNSNGFGIIHWTTRPLDIYFKSLSQQVWQNSLNESLKVTVNHMAEKTFSSVAPVFKEYLYEWITKAAMFGRETSEYFYDMKDTEKRKQRFQLWEYGNPLDYPENAVKEAHKRVQLLDQVDISSLSDQAKEWYHYFYGFEQFVISFNSNQQLLIDAFDLIEQQKFDQARQVLSKADPERSIQLFAEFSSRGEMTRGEEGLIVSLNLRWLPDFIVFRQKLRMIPIRYNFAPTFHEKLAGSSRGKYTFFYTEDQTIWLSMGEEETGAPIKTMDGKDKVSQVALSMVDTEQPFDFELGIWRPLRRHQEWQNEALLAGKYEVELWLFDPAVNQDQNRIFQVQIIDEAGKTLVREKVDYHKEVGTSDQPLKLTYPVNVEETQKLNLKLIPLEGNVMLNGLVINPID